MTAFVVTADPVRDNSANYFSAEIGFYQLGYYVERYELSELKAKSVSGETPVFGGVESIEQVLPCYVSLPYYPAELSSFMFRSVEKRPIEKVAEGEFFKPLEEQHKLFSPRIRDESFECDLAISRIPESTQVLVSDAIEFVSEFRVYVREGKILNVCFYKGNPLARPSSGDIQKMVAAISHHACAFGLDVGVTKEGNLALVEMNDFCCLGNYGLRAKNYSLSIALRWKELWNQFAESTKAPNKTLNPTSDPIRAE